MRFCSDRGIEYQFVDLQDRVPGQRELDVFARAAGDYESLLDTDSPQFRKSNLAYMEYDPVEVITENPGLMRTPIVRTSRGVLIQPSDEELASLFQD